MHEKKYLKKLSNHFPPEDEILTEIINLKAIQNLPKGTEFFISDIHGEYEGFNHMINIGSGIIKDKINLCFKEDVTESFKRELVKIIAYPSEVIAQKKATLPTHDFQNWCKQVIHYFTELIVFCSSKYSRSKLRKRLPKKYRYLGEELIYTNPNEENKSEYFASIIANIIELEIIEDVIIEFSKTLKLLVIDHIHIVGDIFDRGAEASKVIDLLEEFPSIDIQWGNHDILWLAAYCGSEACLLTLLRIATRYGYLFNLEKSYGLNLRSLFQFAEKNYEYVPAFSAKENKNRINQEAFSKVQQALLIMQLKVEGQIIQRNPEFEMSDSLYLDKLSPANTLEIDGKKCSISNPCFQLVDSEQPYELSEEEKKVITDLMYSFQHSAKLKKQMRFLYEKGGLYLTYNSNLLFHGCIPLDENGHFQSFLSEGIKGKKLMDFFETQIRNAYLKRKKPSEATLDLLWYCWCGRNSPLFGRKKMKTFESYFIADPSLQSEESNPYFSLREDKPICEKILAEFGLNSETSCIINGHTPIKTKQGESPIKAEGKLFVIDGGLSKPYQKSTGIAGYTLLNNSYGFQLVTHTPFLSINEFLSQETDYSCLTRVIDRRLPRRIIRQTTIGQEIAGRIQELISLYHYLNEEK